MGGALGHLKQEDGGGERQWGLAGFSCLCPWLSLHLQRHVNSFPPLELQVFSQSQAPHHISSWSPLSDLRTHNLPHPAPLALTYPGPNSPAQFHYHLIVKTYGGSFLGQLQCCLPQEAFPDPSAPWTRHTSGLFPLSCPWG